MLHDGVWQAIFRRVDPSTAHPFALSNILLVPFSGRVSGGGFTFDGTFHALPRNVETELYPIHGNGFTVAWDVASLSADLLTLTLSAEGPGPFRYDATMSYRLQGAGLVMELSLVEPRQASVCPMARVFIPGSCESRRRRCTRRPAAFGSSNQITCQRPMMP